ncbi:SGNH/GDSL hydrolase family protein [Alienimonas sp. DA493]|uniref:SGNH/GDSL hydrolase family protein n=1 Tax=Alienimonas sp. DA493 TaxID=3373605 RepID=UPI00375446BA
MNVSPHLPTVFPRRTLFAAGAAAAFAGCGGGTSGPGPARNLQGRADGENAAGPVVLLGDSVFDNAGYVAGGKSTSDHLEEVMAEAGEGWSAELKARDGAVVEDVPGQFAEGELTGSYAVLSAGGNDALRSASILTKPVSVATEVFNELADLRESFEARYDAAVAAVADACQGRLTVCTIYDPNYEEPRRQRPATAALPAFNDIITRVAVRRGLPVIDLRTAFVAPDDYANPIEPSVEGGLKLAELIRTVVTTHDFAASRSRFYTV